ncbi:MAG: hypothetical protein JNM25_18775 [Planctomycetes bacterium]|nr:hypothetical protein [Planctomycetota bacterium]
MLRPLALAATALLAPTALAQLPCDPLQLQFSPMTIHAGETTTLFATGTPLTLAVLGLDVEPGPVFVPGIGLLHLGLTPALQLIGAPLSVNGEFQFSLEGPCKDDPSRAYFGQALTLMPSGATCLSNPVTVYVQRLGSHCEPPNCILSSPIGSNFNGTAIPAGRSVWFNAIVKVDNLPATGGVVAFRNAHVDFSANGQAYSIPVPNAVITFASGATQAGTSYNPDAFQFDTVVPASYSGNVFLSGLSLPIDATLPGGTNPVTFSGEFLTHEPGVKFQWKWAAAVYTTFSTDYNALCVKPIDGSSQNPYANSDHAGTPECFKPYVVGGARGGGGSNWTGSYSGTKSVACQ